MKVLAGFLLFSLKMDVKKEFSKINGKLFFYVCTVQVMFVCIYDEIPIVSVL